MKDAYKQWASFNKELEVYFNPIGQLYIKYVGIFKFLVIGTFLSDVGDGLKCETSQIGCNLVCLNRYLPINHKKLWGFEFFIVALVTSVFVVLNYFSKKAFERHTREGAEGEPPRYQAVEFESLGLRQRKSVAYQSQAGRNKFVVQKAGTKKEQIRSSYTTGGYILMLVLRLAAEVICLLLEFTLAKHQSQKHGLWERFQLNEHWDCVTNNEDTQGYEDDMHSVVLPHANRTFFHRDWRLGFEISKKIFFVSHFLTRFLMAF